jgi:hypothetical protein
MTNTAPLSQAMERAELLAALAKQRRFLLQTVRGLDDEQASRRLPAGVLTQPAKSQALSWWTTCSLS